MFVYVRISIQYPNMISVIIHHHSCKCFVPRINGHLHLQAAHPHFAPQAHGGTRPMHTSQTIDVRTGKHSASTWGKGSFFHSNFSIWCFFWYFLINQRLSSLHFEAGWWFYSNKLIPKMDEHLTTCDPFCLLWHSVGVYQGPYLQPMPLPIPEIDSWTVVPWNNRRRQAGPPSVSADYAWPQSEMSRS